MNLTVTKNPERVHEKPSRILFYGVLLFFIFEYTRPVQYFPILGVLKLNTLIPVSVFFFSLVSKTNPDNSRILRNNNSRWILFFVFLLIGSILTADVTFYSYIVFRSVVGYLLAYFFIRKQVTDLKRMKVLFATLILVHIIVAVLSPDIILHPETRSYLAQGTFLGDGNDFALSLCIVIPFAFFLFQEAKNTKIKILFLITSVILGLCIVGTQSRGGTLALGSIVLYMWIKSRKKIVGVILIIFSIVAVLWYAPPQYFIRIKSIKEYKAEGSARGRILAWKSAINMALDRPFLGVGTGHFSVKFGTEYRPEGFGRTDLPWLNAHSIYFLILGELGIPGIIFLLGIILTNIFGNEKEFGKIKKKHTELSLTYQRLIISLNSGLIAFAVGGTFLSAIYYPHIYILAGLLGSQQYLYEESKDALLTDAKH